MNFKRKIKIYFKFIRPFAFVGIFFVVAINAVIAIKATSQFDYEIHVILLGALAVALLASAANTLNNIFDKQIDAINKPFRALPAGEISNKEAVGITIFLYFLSFFLVFQINIHFFIIYLIMFFITIFYSCPPFVFKKNFYLAYFFLALTRGLLVILAGWSLVGSINYVLPWYLGIIFFFFLLGSSATKDFLDVEGDKKNNFSTLPVKFGVKKSGKIIAPFILSPFILIPFGVVLDILNIKVLFLMLFVFYAFYIISLMFKKPAKRTVFDNNHISWKHIYILYIILHLSFLFVYLVSV